MFTRRARFKPSANLGAKRTVKDVKVVKDTKTEETVEKKTQESSEKNVIDEAAIVPSNTISTSTTEPIVKDTTEPINYPDDEIFKSPRNIAQKCIEPFVPEKSKDKLDDGHYRDTQGPLSPLKIRQRIRATPYLAIRRNSTQGYGSDAEDELRKNRSNTISSQSGIIPIQRRIPPLSRVRTESSCSNISDREPSLKISRKNVAVDDHLRISAAKKEFQVRFNGKAPEKSLLKMFDLIYYNPVTNPMTYVVPEKSTSDDKSSPKKDETDTTSITEPEHAEVEPQVQDSAMPVPQLKLGPNGEMILDEQSLVIETTAEKEARETLANSNVIYMDEFSGSSGFYRREKRTKDWSSEETIKFYRCLHTVGTDFSLMLTLFPKRTRRDLKLKFKKEEKQNLNLINKALLHPKTFNIEELKSELEREEMEYSLKKKNWEELKKTALNATKKKGKPKTTFESKGARGLTDGEIAYANENALQSPKPYAKKPKICEDKPQSSSQNIEELKEKACDDLFPYASYDLVQESPENTSPGSVIRDDILESLDMLETEERDLRCDKLIELVTSGQISPSKALDALNDDQLISDDISIGTNSMDAEFKSAGQDSNHVLENNIFNPNNKKLDICNILTELMNGSLVIVASEDEKDPSKVINEIYVMCKETGTLSEKPLDLSEDIIECILNELNA